ncbi:MAG: adenylyl-sulfate kinase [Pseudomonadota bacterium]
MTIVKAANITWHNTHVDRKDRERLLGQKGCTIWFTGLPSSGKSTTAFTLEHELISLGYMAYVLDGDNVRHGLNKNLGFSAEDREENIRRVGEIAKLFADGGVITLTSFISPYLRDRDLARKVHNDAGLCFVEIFVDTPMEICERRDPKGLYKKARLCEIKDFTGINDPYEPPLNPEIVVRTAEHSPHIITAQILSFLIRNGILIVEKNRATTI